MKKLRKAAPAAAEKCLPPDHGLVNYYMILYDII